MEQFLEQRFQCLLTAWSLEAELLQPGDEASRPVCRSKLFRQNDTVKTEKRFDLVLTTRLFLNKTMSGSNEGSIFRRHTSRNIDCVEFTIAQISAQLSCIHPVGLVPLLFVLGG